MAWLEQRRFEPGIRELRESLRLVPSDAWAWMDLGIGLAAVGDVRGAGEAFRQAARLRPDDDTIQLNLGIHLAMQGDVEGARSILGFLRARGSPLAPDLDRLLGR